MKKIEITLFLLIVLVTACSKDPDDNKKDKEVFSFSVNTSRDSQTGIWTFTPVFKGIGDTTGLLGTNGKVSKLFVEERDAHFIYTVMLGGNAKSVTAVAIKEGDEGKAPTPWLECTKTSQELIYRWFIDGNANKAYDSGEFYLSELETLPLE